MNTLSKPSTSSRELKQLIGIVSFAAVVHSHLYWVYSIIYIAYHKISPHHEQHATLRWRSVKAQQQQEPGPPKKKKTHSRKKSLTSKPRPIMPTTGKHKVITTVEIATTVTKDIRRKPLLQAFRTFPSPTSSTTKNPFNVQQLIKSQRKTRQRSPSDALPALVEINSRSSVEDTSSCNSAELEEEELVLVTSSSSKRNRALGLFRSTFHRSHSTSQLLQQSTSFSSLSDGEVEFFDEVVTKKRTRKRDAILGITRKLSGRRNLALALDDTAIHIPTSTTEDDDSKKNRAKLFRNLPSWKKEKKSSAAAAM